MTDVIVTQSNEVSTASESLAVEYLKGLGMKIPEKYQTQFIELCKAFSLNPFKRECYAVGYGDKYNIITGYEVYIKRAERTCKLDGWKVDVKGTFPNMSATITIYRKDWKMPFEHTVLFSEAKQNSPIWQKQPTFMLKKVAIAQGFRLCFPDELGGMPYTSDELPEIERNITNEATVLHTVDNREVQNKNVEVQKESVEKSDVFKMLLENHKKDLDEHFDYAWNVYNTGDVDLKRTTYNRCVAYLGRKGIAV